MLQKIELLKVTRSVRMKHPVRDNALYSEMFLYLKDKTNAINIPIMIAIYTNSGRRDENLRKEVAWQSARHVLNTIWSAGNEDEHDAWRNAFATYPDLQNAYQTEYDNMIAKELKVVKKENAQLRARERKEAKAAVKETSRTAKELQIKQEAFVTDAVARRGVSTIQQDF